MKFRTFVAVAALTLTLSAGAGCAFVLTPDDNFDDGVWFVPDDFPTIQSAIDFAFPGEAVLVRTGIYSPSTNGEFFPIFLKNGVDVIGEDPEDTIVDAENTNYVFDAFRFDSVLQGFTILGGLGVRGGGIFADDSRGVLANLYIIGNRADDRGSGIFVSRSFILLVQNVVVADNARSNLNGNPAQVEIEDSDIDFFNNTVAQGDSDGIRINAGSLGIYENNIFYLNGSDGFGVGFADEANDPNGPIIEFNEFFANLENDFFIAGQLLSADEANALTPDINDNFNADPLFTDPLNDLFTLQPGSPAFNAGNPDPAFDNPDGSRNTLGAYGGPGALLP